MRTLNTHTVRAGGIRDGIKARASDLAENLHIDVFSSKNDESEEKTASCNSKF